MIDDDEVPAFIMHYIYTCMDRTMHVHTVLHFGHSQLACICMYVYVPRALICIPYMSIHVHTLFGLACLLAQASSMHLPAARPYMPRDRLMEAAISQHALSAAASYKANASATVDMVRWPSGLRRRIKAPIRKGAGSNPARITDGEHTCGSDM